MEATDLLRNRITAERVRDGLRVHAPDLEP